MIPLAYVNQQNNSNQQFINKIPTVVSATEMSNDLKHKQSIFQIQPTHFSSMHTLLSDISYTI